VYRLWARSSCQSKIWEGIGARQEIGRHGSACSFPTSSGSLAIFAAIRRACGYSGYVGHIWNIPPVRAYG
jgi:hypothetical protein